MHCSCPTTHSTPNTSPSPPANDIELRKRYHLDAKQERQIRKSFCKRDQQPKILIVTEKQLTGFDTWPCAVL